MPTPLATAAREADDPILPLPPGMRRLLLDVLALAYPPSYPQARLSNAPDSAIAWQIQSAMDSYADYAARAAFSDYGDAPLPGRAS